MDSLCSSNTSYKAMGFHGNSEFASHEAITGHKPQPCYSALEPTQTLLVTVHTIYSHEFLLTYSMSKLQVTKIN